MKTFKFFCLLLMCFVSRAQQKKNVDHQSILWTRYYNQLTLNHKWTIHTEFDNRIFIKPVEENLFVFRTQGKYKINEQLEIGAGFAYFAVATQIPEITNDFKIPEYRIQQDITLKNSIGKFILNQRLQIEERFIHKANKLELLHGTTFSFRFRYRIQADCTLWKKENLYLKALFSDEIMINAGKEIIKNTFDQNRIYAALQYGINKNIAFEIGYLKSFQQRSSGTDYFDRDIIRLSIFHKIKLNK